ncbi:MAG: hypothetical protein IJY39_08115 [Clostridia bacterium]|nr:hypothetical protein [Clostridia bacterium]
MTYKTYNILDYGATSDGRLCTREVQNAIDACFLAGGGIVDIPEGEYVVAGLRLRSNVTLHLLRNARLVGSIDPEDYFAYLDDELEPIPVEDRNMIVSTAVEGHTSRSIMPYSRWNNAIIRVINAENVAIIGELGSIIDGRNCFDAQGEENYRGPHAINIWFSKNITLRDYAVINSANWAHAIQNSQNITCKTVSVRGGHDGFDVRTCDNVLIEDCVFRTGDDCIAGFDNIDVTIRRCVFDSACSMLRFGGSDVLVEECYGSAPSTYGFRGHLTPEQKKNRADTDENCRHSCHDVFLYYCDNRAKVRRTPGNIVFRSCDFYNPDSVLNHPFGHLWCSNRALDNITFEDCLIEGVRMPSRLSSPANEPLTLIMKNCKVTAREGFENEALIEAHNLKKIVLDGTTFENFNDPTVACTPDCEIVSTNSTAIKLAENKNPPPEGF